jgi:hypothetical protein
MAPASPNKPTSPRGRAASEDAAWPEQRWWAPAGLGALVLLAYANSLSLGLAGDSQFLLTQDPRLQSLTLHNLALILSKSYWWPLAADLIYRPVTIAFSLRSITRWAAVRSGITW